MRDQDEAEQAAAGVERPSRSARKRAAEELQKLGERLLDLRPTQLAMLDLPESLQNAVAAARRIPRGPARARQRQYIGRLMREIDAEPIRTALAQLPGAQAAHAKMPR